MTRPLIPVDAADFGVVVASLGFAIAQLPASAENLEIMGDLLILTARIEQQIANYGKFSQ